jgi:hypothetical protein
MLRMVETQQERQLPQPSSFVAGQGVPWPDATEAVGNIGEGW